MISNISRIQHFLQCREKSFNWDELRLQGQRTHIALMTGGSFHDGAAHYFANRDAKAAIEESEQSYRRRLKDELILPEERATIEQQVTLARRMTVIFIEHYSDDEMQVLQPEVKFRVPLPNTLHHCLFFHRILHPDIPFDKCPYTFTGVYKDGVPSEGCMQPHYFQGKTDAVIQWKGKTWIQEHKTSAMTGNIFFDRFLMDFQPTGYLYGVGRQLGLEINGFILNVLKKPMKNARDQTAVGFEREPYVRTQEDLARFEGEMIEYCNEYERAFTRRIVNSQRWATYGSRGNACTAYMRRCEYFDLCFKHISGLETDQFVQRPGDYIDRAYYEVLGLPIPESLKEMEEELPNVAE